jgi:hypothetical protein
MPGGEVVPAQLISRRIARVSMRGRHEVWFVVENLSAPSDLPAWAVVNSDDLPDDQEYARVGRTFKVRRKEPAGTSVSFG